MLQVRDLEYTVRDHKGKHTGFKVHHVNFELEQGYFMCLLGENGSGKSTLLRLLYGLLTPDRGSICWKGKRIGDAMESIRQEVAYVGEEDIFFREKSIRENVEVLSRFYAGFQMEKFYDYLKQFECERGVEKKCIGEISTGQKRQIQLAFAMARSPRLLLLDEPTANLDPVFRVEFMELLQQLISREQISVLMSTHILDDVEEIADYICLLDCGKMVVFGDRECVIGQGKNEILRDLLRNNKEGEKREWK